MYHTSLDQDDIRNMTPGQVLDRYEELQDVKGKVAKARSR